MLRFGLPNILPKLVVWPNHLGAVIGCALSLRQQAAQQHGTQLAARAVPLSL